MLRIAGLSKAFGGIKAVDNVSLDLRRGELRCLIGPNGAGKSTLFSLVMGHYLPNAGSVELDGEDITSLQSFRRVRHGVSMKFQTTRVYNALSVAENLEIARRDDGGLRRRRPGALGAGDVRSRAARGPARRFADPRGKAVARNLSGVGAQSSAFSCWTSRRWA